MQSRSLLKMMGLVGLLCAIAAPAFAQAQSGQSAAPEAVVTRPATTTINGDTGLWFVPDGEVLPAKKWSLSHGHQSVGRD